MRLSWSTILQPLGLAALVTTLWVPPGAVIALFVCALLGWSFESVVTFGGRFDLLMGMVLWWVLGFAPALAYAVAFPPWAPVTSPRAPRP